MISVIHPSRGRWGQAEKTAYKWARSADTEIEYLLVVEPDQRVFYTPCLMELHGKMDGCQMLFENNNESAIEAINYGASQATGNIIVVISDDFDCPPHWDTLLLEATENKTDFCAKTSDGHQDWLITLPIMDRKYYERFGYVYNPDYKHMFADLEMTSVAWMLGRYIELPLTFKHNHYSLTGQQPDAINRKNNATWGQGQMLFKKRLSKNFGIDPVQGLPDLKQHFV